MLARAVASGHLPADDGDGQTLLVVVRREGAAVRDSR